MGAQRMTASDQLALRRQLRKMRAGRNRRDYERARRRMVNDWVERAQDQPKGRVAGIEQIEEAQRLGAQRDS